MDYYTSFFWLFGSLIVLKWAPLIEKILDSRPFVQMFTKDVRIYRTVRMEISKE